MAGSPYPKEMPVVRYKGKDYEIVPTLGDAGIKLGDDGMIICGYGCCAKDRAAIVPLTPAARDVLALVKR
jgi:hypothetical protein